MESDYDRKFEEMKQYIPFLESMIKRLESTSSPSANPRQAQLDKIRSLRDLLLDKKKRMKMENLLKCEQVLVNLYAKVEQKDAATEMPKSDLHSARNKLNNMSQLPENDPDTLPEIAPASEMEVVCTPGSKEPALFHRRPNKNSRTPTRISPGSETKSTEKSPQKIVPKRNYTRVLVSPEPSLRRWSTIDDSAEEKSLFSRRTSRKSPKKPSPQNKDKKTSFKPEKPKPKDLNITLNVPEESLNSLNTGDILSRIIKCPDNDVDIDTLRDLRTQILGELKQTGANDDISDLILKSYKNKKRKNKQKKEVEEGELSDSESEAIESIYGSLVVVEEKKNNSGQSVTASTEKEKQARKIQICLVINSDKEGNAIDQNTEVAEVTDFEVFDIEKNDINKTAEVSSSRDNQKVKKGTGESLTKSLGKQMVKQMNITATKNKPEALLTIEVEDDDDLKKDDTSKNKCKDSDSSYIDISSSDNDSESLKSAPFKANFYNEHKDVEKDKPTTVLSEELSHKEIDKSKKEKTPEKQTQQEKSKPSVESSNSGNTNEALKNLPLNSGKSSEASSEVQEKENEISKDDIEIPLLNTEPAVPVPAKQNVLSEIDILQALKNEILSDSIAIPGSDAATPLLHQPKITKVASAQEIMTKKRISIEKYKEKSVTKRPSLFLKEPNNSQSNDNSKKTSLKLTEQEQQRFNFLPLPLDSSDEEDKETTTYSTDDIYGDLAPQSPENNDTITCGSSTPIIIPVDPVKPTTVVSNADIDMRTLMPTLSSNAPKPVPPPPAGLFLQSMLKETPSDPGSIKGNEKQVEPRRPPLLDPRVRRDLNKSVGKDSPNPHTKNPERTPRYSGNLSCVPPNMTPSRQAFDLDDSASRKHVYAPFPTFEPRDQRELSANRDTHGPRWEPNSDPALEDRNSRWDLWKDTDLRDTGLSRKWDDRDQRVKMAKPRYDRNDGYSHEQSDDYSHSRIDCPRTPVHSFGRSDCPATPSPSFGRVDPPVNPYGRSECPATPVHPFGRSDCPLTPSHPFGRSECPTTPIHTFGRGDCPLTPSHPFGRTDGPLSHPYGRTDKPMTPNHHFGRSDAPLTPSHPFGRSDAPMTSSHSFGRSDAPMTPSHPFGRSEAPMTPSHPFGRPDMGVAPMTPSHPFGRSDYQHTSSPKVVKDPRLNRSTDYQSKSRLDDDRGAYYKDRRKSDLPNNTYKSSESYPNYREQSVGKNDRSLFNRERTPGREPSVGRNLQRDYESDRLYTRDRGGSRSNDYRRENERESRNNNDGGPRREYHLGGSIGRSDQADERFQRSSSRAPSDNRNNPKQCNENTLSVKSQTGRSFTIDTSVNTTFQEFLNGKGLQVFDYSIDSRRQRAASVGRTLTRDASVGRTFREGSVGRTLSKSSYSGEQDTSGYKRIVNFARARSMGRELVDAKERSFKEIKAELKSYKSNYTQKETNKNLLIKKSNYRDPRSRKEQFEKQIVNKNSIQTKKKIAYSPRKNNRDPRMHKGDSYSDSRSKSRYEDKKKNYGIVYSSDNIAKGTILGSGYGVKNYKIPKIKKPIEEKVIKEDPVHLKVDNKKEKSIIEKQKCTKAKEMEVDKNKEITIKAKCGEKKEKIDMTISGLYLRVQKKSKEIEDQNKSQDYSKKRTCRSKIKTKKSDEETVIKTRKTKKAIIESDSESDTIDQQNEKNDIPETSKKTNITKGKQDLHGKNEDGIAQQRNNSFDIDEIFPENMNSYPVLDNINELLADLDNDIDTTKAEDFTENINIDNMFDSINSPEGNMDESLNGMSDVITKNSLKNQENCSDKDTAALNPKKEQNIKQIADNIEQPLQLQTKNERCEDVVKETVSLFVESVQKKFDDISNVGSIQDNTVQNSNDLLNISDKMELANVNFEAVVSTTRVEEESLKTADEDRSTPDSTLNTGTMGLNKPYDVEGLPDSTNEKHEMLSDVSSTRDQAEISVKDTESSCQKQNSVGSIGNLLSMLQDKSKIKELLSMLGDSQSGDNEKIKKKLEKLSEIVSDEDDTNDGTIGENFEKYVEEQKNIETNNKDYIISDVIGEPHTEILDEKAEINEHEKSNNSVEDSNMIKTADNKVEDTEQTNKDNQNAKVIKAKKARLKRGKKGKGNKIGLPGKRVTRSGAANLLQKPKKPSRELRQLQESIKEMFIKDDVLNATGIRMCRLAKLDDKNPNQEQELNSQVADTKPVVVIEKMKGNVNTEEKHPPKMRKKPGPKPKLKKVPVIEDNIDAPFKDIKPVTTPKHKPGPKSKTKNYHDDSDPYSFDDSVSEATTTRTSEQEIETETEDDSLASSQSFGSSEVLADLKKKPKRKKRGWQLGIIKKRRKKNEPKPEESLLDDNVLLPNKEIIIPDMNCFTDKSYCFLKNISEYPCRLCEYNGPEIVKHYKTDHPHTEIPLSRMNAVVAREAVEQCEDVNFQAISKMPTERYVCRFCFEEFGRKQNVLEEFFWHVVSMHTGEYKRLCSECVNVTRCPFNLDIPPPPKDLKGQLIGYICGKCNFTQISLENLKTHVIVRHNDEQTAVYTINLAVMSKKTIQTLMKRCNGKERVVRSLRSKLNVTEINEPSDRSELTDSASDAESLKIKTIKEDNNLRKSVHSKLSFENDDSISDTLNTEIKVETEDIENDNQSNNAQFEETEPDSHSDAEQNRPSSDILDCSHFKISYSGSGTKEYVCCINGIDNHYKTHLLISMKKHVQIKHSEIWDGYCSACKVIVVPQGEHRFKECLQHMLDKHMDNFPVLHEAETATGHKTAEKETTSDTSKPSTESPLTDQTSTDVRTSEIEEALPKIESVVSLGTTSESQVEVTSDLGLSIFKNPMSVEKSAPKPEEPYKYEEMQAEVMSKKHFAILESMLTEDKLVQIYKCAGRFCSFTTDSADAAMLHASTHHRIGGENALLCTYCDYDCKGNAIDLVMHVFKMHGRCPYVCGQCFYRAVASQLVLAHIHRVHGGVVGGTVLQTATVTPGDDDSADTLPREIAVQHYVCLDGTADKTCKFKTYIQGKYLEHLVKHTAPYLCYICSLETNHPTDLVTHMKTHGMKLYQCTLCVQGGDNEGDFLAHSSSRHPTRQPQAYLRIINNKDGGSKTMVLPLVKLNKSSVSVRVVTPNSNANNPAREAEKALDMEKLIAAMPTLEVSSSESTRGCTKTLTPISESRPSPQILTEEVTAEADMAVLQQRCLVTPPPSISAVKNDSLLLTPVLKQEPIDENEKNLLSSSVICLDSDEEDDSRPTEKNARKVIDLSDDDQTSIADADKLRKIGPFELYKCSNCKVTFKSSVGFKKHVASCFVNKNNYLCAHCPFAPDNLEEFFNHYNWDHAGKDERKPVYICATCSRAEKSLSGIKYHVKKDHGMANLSVTSNPDGNYVVNGTTRGRPGPKRKLSGGSVSESSPKRIRYGAQDLHKLPQKPILDELAYCSECEFSTKVRLNLVRHIQQHADNQLVPQTTPVNPVPHLETNEKHFDRMINLASSSLELGRAEKSTPSVTLHIPPEAASRYPKYVSDRQRHTCGAKGCSYISVDEAMLKIHWETLHATSNDFHCVHCPPYQYLDTSKPLTASRIIAHLKMHDIRLYACSSCTYYHYRKQVLEKHLAEVHKGSGQIMVVREESTNAPPAVIPLATNVAPTMDLKAWKCGMCAFKSMLRPEVIEHCSKSHNTKMQFKCPVCPFRTSTLENVTKHQKKSHPENNEDVFYYYYREGSIPDEPDGTPRWVKQRQKIGNSEPEVKTETPESTQQNPPPAPLQPVLPATISYGINLDIVKQEVVDSSLEESMATLCQKFGDICDPNGLKYKCPLCMLVTEDNKESMRSHLYEELQYRKWACSICCYKAFHKIGLNEHMVSEHRQSRAIEPIELDADTRVERWVNKVLDHQTTLIESNKSNLAKQKIQVEKPSMPSTNSIEKPIEPITDDSGKETEKLIQAFGQFGTPDNVSFCCPKCAYQTTDEGAIKTHLEIELNMIRWRCSCCFENSQNYHEAQLHSKTCKSSRPGQASRPVEAIRDPTVREAWAASVIRTQKLAMKKAPESEPKSPVDDMLLGPQENSLLVVRYEERVPTPEVEMIGRRKRPAPATTPAASPDSDDERLVIDEPSTDEADTPKKYDSLPKKCSYCPFSARYRQQFYNHILRHYNLKPMMCCYCEQTYYHRSMDSHTLKDHPNKPKQFKKTQIPSGPPLVMDLFSNKKQSRKRSSSSNEEYPKIKEGKQPQSKEEVKRDDEPKLTCLTCERSFLAIETESHTHDKQPTYFAKKGDVVVKCCVCLSLFPNINRMQEHNVQSHPNTAISYSYFKLSHNNREILQCGHCSKRFKFFRDLKIHHNGVHNALQLKYDSRPYYPGAYDFECETESKRESSKPSDNTGLPQPEKAAKRVARKSTTKLPRQRVARKSTTKLPFNADSDIERDYSYYGSKPAQLNQFENVTTLMPIFNTMIPLQKLSEIIKINPVVLVKDCKK